MYGILMSEKTLRVRLTAIMFLLAAYNRGISKACSFVASSLMGYIKQKENSASKYEKQYLQSIRGVNLSLVASWYKAYEVKKQRKFDSN